MSENICFKSVYRKINKTIGRKTDLLRIAN